MAMQVIKRDHPEVFTPGDKTYELEVITGARDGVAILAGDLPMNSDAEVVQAVSSELQLLHDVRRFGPTSYFAYRMGVLSALVANAAVPLGFAWSDEDVAIQQTINVRIDEKLDSFGYLSDGGQLTSIREIREYFKERRPFMQDDAVLIRDDFKRGSGFDGYINSSAQTYFDRSVAMVADVWHTVFEPNSAASGVPASKNMLTWYFVKEIAFLLEAKKNFHQAEKSYESFEQVNSDVSEAFDEIGDLFYEFGSSEAIERGVREWRIAYDMGGPARREVSEKLSAHYIKQGSAYLEKAAQPGSEETDLPNALTAFEQALDFNRGSDEAANLIQETHKAMAERKARFELAVNLIASAERVQKEGDNQVLAEDFGGAIVTYERAKGFYETVTEEFTELSNASKSGVSKVKKAVGEVILKVQNKANDAIAKGDQLQEENNYPAAVQEYSRVDAILGVIPPNYSQVVDADTKKIRDLALTDIDEARKNEERWKAAQEAAAKAAQGGGGGGAGGGGAGAGGGAAGAGGAAAGGAAAGAANKQ